MSQDQPDPTRPAADAERLRQHPTPRFAPPQHRYDLDEATATLRRELDSGQAGHRQQTLYKQGATTVALFLFAAGSGLRAHRAKGIVMIHLLEGHVQITAEDQVHDLRAGHLLVLASGVEHDVAAQAVSRMLLTVHLDAAAAKPTA
jgi:quercetin dioxygenase-like cupin family protein